MLSGSPYVCPDLGPTTFANHFGPRASKNHFYLQRCQSHPNHVYSGRFESICPLRLRHAQTIESRAPNEHNYPTNRSSVHEAPPRKRARIARAKTKRVESWALTGGELGVFGTKNASGSLGNHPTRRRCHRSGIALTTVETGARRDASMKYLCYELVDPSPVR